MILLDTCVLLWLASDQKKISKGAVQSIKKNPGGLYVSSISALEIGIKNHKKKLILPKEPMDWYEDVLNFHGIGEIPVDYRVAIISSGLTGYHNDPADRMIIATAQIYNCPILTPDPLIKKYSQVTVIW